MEKAAKSSLDLAGPRARAKLARRVLVVDDSRMQRKILTASLNRWGYNVLEAGSGEEGLALCRAGEVSLVVSDWEMPGMDGLEFCRAYRAIKSAGYGYFILLTSHSEKGEIASGLEAGADDFLTKPVNAGELRARIRAGERILLMQSELVEKNRIVSAKMAELHSLYDSLDRDLAQAQKLQQSLLRERVRRFGPSRVSLTLHSSGHVGGDLVGFFVIDKQRIGLYAIDVSGHGITSALMTARLAGLLGGPTPEQNLMLIHRPDGSYDSRPPAAVAARLNDLLQDDGETDHYFTLVLAEVDLAAGRVHMVQAGHPSPAVQRRDGSVRFVGSGGMPVGLLPEAVYDGFEFALVPGERLIIYSDGLSECADANGRQLEEKGLARLLAAHAGVHGPELLETLVWEVELHAGKAGLQDDLSALLFEYGGPPVARERCAHDI